MLKQGGDLLLPEIRVRLTDAVRERLRSVLKRKKVSSVVCGNALILLWSDETDLALGLQEGVRKLIINLTDDERADLKSIIMRGNHNSNVIVHALILLWADENHLELDIFSRLHRRIRSALDRSFRQASGALAFCPFSS
jgi:hypothetical protein